MPLITSVVFGRRAIHKISSLTGRRLLPRSTSSTLTFPRDARIWLLSRHSSRTSITQTTRWRRVQGLICLERLECGRTAHSQRSFKGHGRLHGHNISRLSTLKSNDDDTPILACVSDDWSLMERTSPGCYELCCRRWTYSPRYKRLWSTWASYRCGAVLRADDGRSCCYSGRRTRPPCG